MHKKPFIIAIIVVAVLIISAGVWRWEKVKKNEEIKKIIEQEKISSIQQAAQIQLVWYEVTEIGIKFKVDAEIKDELIYEYRGSQKGYGSISFSSKKLSQITGCEAGNGPLTSFIKLQGVPADYENKEYIISRNPKQFNDFFIMHDGPQAICAVGEENINKWNKYFIENPKFKEWSKQAFKTIETIK